MQFSYSLWPELLRLCCCASIWDICPTLLNKGRSTPSYVLNLPQLFIQVNTSVDFAFFLDTHPQDTVAALFGQTRGF